MGTNWNGNSNAWLGLYVVLEMRQESKSLFDGYGLG